LAKVESDPNKIWKFLD